MFNKIYNMKRYIFLLCIILFSTNLFAEEQSDIRKDLDKLYCKKNSSFQPKFFINAYNEAIQIKQDFCKEISVYVIEELTGFDSNSFQYNIPYGKRTINLYGYLKRIFPSSDIDTIIFQEIKTLENKEGFNQVHPEVLIQEDIIELSSHRMQTPGLAQKCELKAKETDENSSCIDMLKEFDSIFTLALGTFSMPQLIVNKKSYPILLSEWEDFYTDSKPQTIWEMLYNGKRFQKKNSADGFLPPPNKQIIFLHPGFVIENIKSSHNGQKVNQSATLEMVGINWWKRNKWYQPSGLSLNALYVLQDDIPNRSGYGISVIFQSKYHIGISKHGSREGIYFSVDLLDFISNRKQNIKESGLKKLKKYFR